LNKLRIAAVAAAVLLSTLLAPLARAQPSPSYTDLWWNASESGWGINLNHQGDNIFATWFTYSPAGKASWYVMSNLARQGDGSFSGEIFQTAGVPVHQISGAPATRTVTAVGNATLRFSGNTAATFAYTVNGATQTKSIARQLYGRTATACAPQAPGASRAASQNFQDLWWFPGESGWGVNVTHQDDNLFVTWFTYADDGTAQWLVGSNVERKADGRYSGALYRTTGTPLAQIDGQTSSRSVTAVGAITFFFLDGERGVMSYTLDGASGSKSIVRQVFGTSVSVCSNAASTVVTPPTPPALAGTDLASWATADIGSRLAFAGSWTPVEAAGGGMVGPFWGLVKTGTAQREGVAVGGWVFNGSFTNTNPDVTPVRVSLLEQQADGTLQEAAARVLGNTLTSGQGSVIAADFNGDGRDDLVFPAHNESPFLWKPSIAFMSRADGGFDRITLPDAVMNHDARLVTIDGRKKILARSFGGSGNNGNGPGFNVIYTWSGANFTVDTSLGDMGGMSVLAGPFTGNSDNWLIIGDSSSGPGVPYSPSNAMLNYAYRFNNGVVSGAPVLLPKPYFNDKPQYAGFRSQWDPYSKTHTSRLWTTDLNQDGLPDILAGQEIWTAESAGLQKAAFQLLVNRGNMQFADLTDALAPEFDQGSTIDYNVRFADVDGSGIETMFHSGPQPHPDLDATKHAQYVLVNDGTGRLYAALHSEFRAMRTQVASYLTSRLPAGSFVDPRRTPQFIAYRTAAGRLNFLAMAASFHQTPPQNRYAFASVALQVDLATDFRRHLAIPTRNGSRRIRTFAGNDTIWRAVSDPDCAIDGGLGVNTAVYPGNRAAWTVTRAGAQVTVRPASGPGGTDTLTRVQRAVFEDQVLDLSAL
jgi:hypothetical protein